MTLDKNKLTRVARAGLKKPYGNVARTIQLSDTDEGSLWADYESRTLIVVGSRHPCNLWMGSFGDDLYWGTSVPGSVRRLPFEAVNGLEEFEGVGRLLLKAEADKRNEEYTAEQYRRWDEIEAQRLQKKNHTLLDWLFGIKPAKEES